MDSGLSESFANGYVFRVLSRLYDSGRELPGDACCPVSSAYQQHLLITEHYGDGDTQRLNVARRGLLSDELLELRPDCRTRTRE
jgi:hypothetical protein